MTDSKEHRHALGLGMGFIPYQLIHKIAGPIIG